MSVPLLEVVDLSKRYGELTAVSSLSLQVGPGELLGLVGPNGAGKTTTLRCLAGIIPATSGIIHVAGHDLGREPVAAKQDIAFLPDEPRLFEHLTVWEHLNLTARIYGIGDWQVRGKELLDELELAGKERMLPAELSRGMKQKLVIACGFLHEPKLLLLDEPLTGLDPLGIRKMKESLKRRAQNGSALVLSSHLLSLVEELCHRVLIISGGKRVAYGTVEEIRGQMTGSSGVGATLEDLFIQITSGPGQVAS